MHPPPDVTVLGSRAPRAARALPIAACLAALAATLCVAPGAPAQQQFADLMVKRHLPRDADPTRAAAFGDVDADGDLDLVLGNLDGHQNRLYLGVGTGIFTDATATHLPVDTDDTHAVVLGDVDGDGDLDLVLGNNSAGRSRQNRLYLNDGAGTFADVTAGRLPVESDFTEAVALGDVDGDRDLDLVVGNEGRDALYLNDGLGHFTDVTSSHMPAIWEQTFALALADVDGDGDLDMALGTTFIYGSFPFPQNRLYLNDGSGTFADATSGRLPAAASFAAALAVGDVDGDDDLDLVLGNSSGGWFPTAQNNLYLNNGSGHFTDVTATHLPADSDGTTDLCVGDADGDGDPDLLIGNYGQNRLYLNSGTGVFVDATAQRVPSSPDVTRVVALGDVDGDRDLDLVFGNDANQNRLYLNDGAGQFADATATRLPVDADHTVAVALGDLDGDGAADLVIGNYGEDRLYLNDGAGVFADVTAQRLPVVSQFTPALVLSDVEADGDLDLVIGALSKQLYLNDGKGNFTDATATHMPTGTSAITALATGDVDGDGAPDLVVGNSGLFGEQNQLLLNNGSGSFADVTGMHMPLDPQTTTHALALGDVDGDGDLDLAVGNHAAGYTGGQQNGLYLNDGTGRFSDATAARMPVDTDYTLALAFGDVDGDGDLDLVVGNDGARQNRLYLNNGRGFFSDATAARMPVDVDHTEALAFGDVDSDGDLDLITGNGRLGFGGGAQQTRLYVNDGQGIFTDAAATRMPVDADYTYALALGDVDGDSDLDLVLGNPTRQNRIYLNLHRQLSAPFFPTLSRRYALEFHAKPGYATTSHTAVAVLSFALAPTPLPLPPMGTFYLDPTVMFALPPISIPSATGRSVQPLPIPVVSSLVGVPLYLQAVVVNDANPSDAFFTGYTKDEIRS